MFFHFPSSFSYLSFLENSGVIWSMTPGFFFIAKNRELLLPVYNLYLVAA